MVLALGSAQTLRRIQSASSVRLHSLLQHGCRRISASTTGFSPPQATETPGWSMRVKIAGGVALGSTIWWMISVAIKYEPGARRVADIIAPGLAVSIEVRLGHGETRRLLNVDPATPFTSLGDIVRKEGLGSESDKSTGRDRSRQTWWLTDFEVLDPDSGVDEFSESGSASGAEPMAEGYLSSALSSLHHSAAPSVFSRDIATCNVRSWWDIALLEQETAAATAVPAGNRGAGRRGAGGAIPAANPIEGARASQGKMTEEQAKSVDEAIERAIVGLQQEMVSGARSVDDAEKEIRELRKQQKDLRRNHLRKSRFRSIF